MRFMSFDIKATLTATALLGTVLLGTVLLGTVLLGSMLLASPASAVDFELTSSNDFLTNNEKNDDLYSFGVGLSFGAGRYDITLRENAFTDKDNDIRFDETYLSVGRDVPFPGRWRAYADVGVVHVGEGILGQGAQNTIHGILGDEEVHLPYIESRHVYPSAGLELERDLRRLGPVTTSAEIELFSALGFQSHAAAAVHGVWEIMGPLTFDARLGVRLSATEFEHLDPWIEDVGPMAEMGVEILDRVILTWSYNEFGTKNQHVRLGYRFKARLGKSAR